MNRIGKTELRRQDLGLLVVLDALIAEGSVTGAANRLNLSQPAVSSELQRLRDWIGDPLLVRVRAGYALTARALELAGPVRRILAEIQETIRSPAPFEPASAVHHFTFATNDAFQLAVVPALMRRLRRDAPGITLDVVASGPSVDVRALEAGAVDLCAGHYSAVPAGLRSVVLLQERLVGLARQGHSVITSSRPTLKQYAQAGHVAIAPQGSSFIAIAQAALARAGHTPNIALRLPHVLAAPLVVAGSDLITTVPERVARAYGPRLGLRIFAVPIPFPPFDVVAVWHERTQQDAALAWLRSTLADVCKTLRAPSARASARK